MVHTVLSELIAGSRLCQNAASMDRKPSPYLHALQPGGHQWELGVHVGEQAHDFELHDFVVAREVDDRWLRGAHQVVVPVTQPEFQDAENVGDRLVLALQHRFNAWLAATNVHEKLVDENLRTATRIVVVPVHVLGDLERQSEPFVQARSKHASENKKPTRARVLRSFGHHFSHPCLSAR